MASANLLDEVREIGELISPHLFGKSYSSLKFIMTADEKSKLQKCELFQCCALAQTIRLEAMKIAERRFKDQQFGWLEVLDICKEVLERSDHFAKQKEELRKRGYLQ